MYFSKDVPLILAVLLCFGRRRKAPIQSAVKQLLLFSSALIVLGTLVATTEGFALVGAVVPLRNILFLPWIAYLLSPGLTGRFDINLIIHTIGVCAIVNAGLGSVQFFLPTGHILNQTIKEELVAVTAIGRVRAYGTFVYISGMADLCVLACWAGAVLMIRTPSLWVGYIYAAAGLVATAAAMSRHGAIEWFVVLTMSLVCTRSGRKIVVVLVGLGVLGLLVLQTAENQMAEDSEVNLTNALTRRHKTADSVTERLTSFYGQVPEALWEAPTGCGIGITQTAQTAVGGGVGMAYEFDLARVAYEIGVVGFLGVLLFRLGMPVIVWRFLLASNRTAAKGWQAVCWPSFWVLALMPTMMITANHVLATFLTVVLVCVLAVAEREASVRQ